MVGLLLGLAVAEVVGGVIASLAALLGAYLGLRADGETAGAASRAYRMMGFGFLCAAGVLLGVAIRANNWLAPTPQQMIERWTVAGYPLPQARELVAYERLGIAVEGWQLNQSKGAAARASSVLFGVASAEDCAELAPHVYRDDVEWENAIRLRGGDWQRLMEATSKLPPETRNDALKATWRLACEAP